MAKKSAAQFKVADGSKPELPPIEDIFETQRKGMLATLEVQLSQDKRFDTYLAVRESHHRFHFEAPETSISFEDAAKIIDEIYGIHVKIKEIVDSMTLEQFTAEDFVNPADALVEFGDVTDWNEVFHQSLLFSAVQPYGQSFDDLRGRMLEEVAKRG